MADTPFSKKLDKNRTAPYPEEWLMSDAERRETEKSIREIAARYRALGKKKE